MVRCSIARCVAEPHGALYHFFISFFSPWLQHPPFTYTVLYLLVCLCVCLDLTGPSQESCQRLEDKLSAVHYGACLCRERVLWEQLFRGQILINERMPEVSVWFST